MEYDKLKYLRHVYTFDKKIINFVTLLSVIYFVFLIIELHLDVFSKMLGILIVIDTIMCLIFISEFLYLLERAKDKKQYIKKYFLDILASVPLMVFVLFWPQLLLLNIFKFLRGVKGLLKIYDFIIEEAKHSISPAEKIEARKVLHKFYKTR
jgi:hypothetical protein